MILNNYLTMQRIAEWKERPLDESLLFEMHRMVTDGTLDDPGLFGAPQMAIYAVDRQPFHVIPESLPTYERLPPR